MELGAQIKKYRAEKNWSQEELAERVYVTRQTISNWECGNSYPDVQSLLLLSMLFGVSLDQLIKGDIDVMKQKIEKEEIQRMNRYSVIFTVLFVAVLLSVIPLFLWPNGCTIAGAAVLYGVTMYFALRVEKLKKENQIQTYREITAFMEGKRLDELQLQREAGKRPYQKVLLAMGSGALALVMIEIAALIRRFLF